MEEDPHEPQTPVRAVEGVSIINGTLAYQRRGYYEKQKAKWMPVGRRVKRASCRRDGRSPQSASQADEPLKDILFDL